MTSTQTEGDKYLGYLTPLSSPVLSQPYETPFRYEMTNIIFPFCSPVGMNLAAH